MRRIYLVRHGETAGQSSIRYHGRNDVPLSELGRRQIGALVSALDGAQPRAVVHSPLCRARESAEILVTGRRWAPDLLETDRGLTEISFGRCEGMTKEEIRAAEPDWYSTWQAGDSDGFPGGEPYAAFGARICEAIAGVVNRYPDGDLLVVAHRGVVRWGMRHLLGIPTGDPDEFTVELGSLTILAGDDRYEVEKFNLVPPLPETPP